MRLVTQIIASVTAMLGLVVIFGWFFGFLSLVQVHQDLVPMQFNTALCFLFMGSALFLLTTNRRQVAAYFSAVVVLIASLTLAEYIFLIDIGIDHLFVHEPKDLLVRMAPNTSMCFLLLGIASFLLSLSRVAKLFFWLIQLNVILVLALSSFGLIGYVSGYQVIFEWGPKVQMALHTSIGLLLVSAGYQNYLFMHYLVGIKRRSYLPFLVSSVVILIFLFIALLVRQNHIQDLQESIQTRNEMIQDSLIDALGHQEKTLKRMTKRVNVDDDFHVMEWKSDAQQYIEDIGSLHALGLHYDDGGNKIVVASVSDLEEVDLSKFPSEGFVKSVLYFLEIKGKEYLVFVTPSENEIEKKSLLVALYGFIDFLDESIPRSLIDEYELNVSLLDKGQPIEEPGINSPFFHQKAFELYDSNFVLNLFGKPEKFLEEINLIDISIIVVGFILGLALSYLIIFANKAFQREQEALEANQAKNVFISNISHEVRNPLNTIMGTTSLLEETNLDEKQSKYLKNIEYSGSHVLSLIEEILDVSKLESGQISLNLTEQSIHQIYEEIVSISSPKIEKKGLSLVSSLNAHHDQITTDPLRLKQVVLNILDNAVKFTKEGEIEFRMIVTESGQLLVKIKDSGIGIPKEKIPFVFDKFFQVDLSQKKKTQGIGLGLAISKEIVTKLGGTIRVESTPGKGTIFSFSIPVRS